MNLLLLEQKKIKKQYKMRIVLKSLLIILLGFPIKHRLTCQTKIDYNLNFESSNNIFFMPKNWFVWGQGYNINVDTIVKHSGNNAIKLSPRGKLREDYFGCVASSIDANFSAKNIELKAWMKFKDVKDGSVGLLLRIDDAAGQPIVFDNMEKYNISGTSNWKEYKINLNYPSDAKIIYIGALLTGTGELWVDDFELYIDGKSIENLSTEKKEIAPAEKDREFDISSKVQTFEANELNTANLMLLGQVWGFLKYYHPFIAKGSLNWDYELFRILPQILNIKTTTERNDLLCRWIDSLGNVKPGKPVKVDKSKTKLQPDLSFIDKNICGDKLYGKLNEIKNADRKNQNYYIELTPGVGNPEFKNENSYGSVEFSDIGYRILSLYRYWNIIHYYFPNKHLIEKNWNNVLKEYIPKFITCKSDLDYKLTVLSLITEIHDTHANIWNKDKTLEDFKGRNYSALQIKFIENKPVVIDYYNKELGEKTGIKVGAIIEKVNGKPVEEIVNKKLPYTPASNYPTQLREIANDLLRTNDTLVHLQYSSNGATYTTNIGTYSSSEVNIYSKYQKKDTCFKIINEDIAYLYPGNIKKGYVEKLMPEVMNKKGLIIDFRCYPSDFIVFTLGNYLTPKYTEFVKFSHGNIITPGLFTLSKPIGIGRKNKGYFKGKVIILLDENTQSSAEYHAMAFRQSPNAKVIGSTTAGADGNVSVIFLPGGIRTMISGIGVYYPNGEETQRVGIIPDIDCKPSINGIKEGRDEMLEKAIQIINN